MPGTLTFIGLGLFDATDLTLKGLEAARSADRVYAEFYTSAMLGTTPEALARLIGKPVRVLGRAAVESGTEILEAASRERVALLVPGDPMSATTHVDLRMRAHAAGIPSRIVHGPSIVTAAAGLLGLQATKFGRATSLPFPEAGFRPTSPLDAIADNRSRGLHTLVLLDLREDGSSLSANEAIRYLIDVGRERGDDAFTEDTLVCVVGRAGSADPRLHAGRAADLLDRDVGPPLHCLVVPGELHFLEREALAAFAGAPDRPRRRRPRTGPRPPRPRSRSRGRTRT